MKYELSSQARIGVYDCLYVALAEFEQCRVATADQRLLKTFPAQAMQGRFRPPRGWPRLCAGKQARREDIGAVGF